MIIQGIYNHIYLKLYIDELKKARIMFATKHRFQKNILLWVAVYLSLILHLSLDMTLLHR